MRNKTIPFLWDCSTGAPKSDGYYEYNISNDYYEYTNLNRYQLLTVLEKELRVSNKVIPDSSKRKREVVPWPQMSMMSAIVSWMVVLDSIGIVVASKPTTVEQTPINLAMSEVNLNVTLGDFHWRYLARHCF